MSTTGRSPDPAIAPSTGSPSTARPTGSVAPTGGPPAIGRSAINEFRKARAQFRLDRAAAEDRRDREASTVADLAARALSGRGAEAPAPESASEPSETPIEPLVLLAHGEPLSLALSRRRRDESASVDRRLRLSRMVAREDRLTATIAELAAGRPGTIDLRDGRPVDDAVDDGEERLAPVVDLRERAVARAEARAEARADAEK
jgi:hypothetical protein